jgi:hypothetical protein
LSDALNKIWEEYEKLNEKPREIDDKEVDEWLREYEEADLLKPNAEPPKPIFENPPMPSMSNGSFCSIKEMEEWGKKYKEYKRKNNQGEI